MHPLQTLAQDARARSSSTAPGARVTAENDEARARALWLAETLGLRPFALADDQRALYHAGCAIASNFLVTLYRVAARARRAGRRAARGARAADGAHDRERLRADRPDRARRLGDGRRATVPRCTAPASSRLYDALAAATQRVRVVRVDRRARPAAARRRRPRADDGRAARRPHRALPRGARPTATCSSPASSSTRRSSRRPPTSTPTRATSSATPALAEAEGVDVLFAPSADEMYPPGFATWVEPAGAAEGLESEHRPRPLPRRRDRLPEALQHRPAGDRVVRPQGRAAGRRAQAARPRPQRRRSRSASSTRCATTTASRSRRATCCLSPVERDAGARDPARSRDPRRRHAPAPSSPRPASSPTTSTSPTSTAPPSPSQRASAQTRLIDNVPLPEGDHS